MSLGIAHSTTCSSPGGPNVFTTLRRAGSFVAYVGVRGDTFATGVLEDTTDFCGLTVSPAPEALEAVDRHPFPPGHHLRHAHCAGRLATEPLLTSDEAAIRSAIGLLEEGLPEPSLLYLPLFSPHPPFGVEEPWYSLHDRMGMPAPALPGIGKAAFIDAMRLLCGLDRLEPSDWAEIVATYYGMVTRVDDQLGRLRRQWHGRRRAERTMTFFFTDHGEYLGERAT